jgi:hypothetical protein
MVGGGNPGRNFHPLRHRGDGVVVVIVVATSAEPSELHIHRAMQRGTGQRSENGIAIGKFRPIGQRQSQRLRALLMILGIFRNNVQGQLMSSTLHRLENQMQYQVFVKKILGDGSATKSGAGGGRCHRGWFRSKKQEN